MNIIYHNGEFIEEGPIFSPRNRLRLGHGVFETALIIVSKNSSFSTPHLHTHLERILHNANMVGINGISDIQVLEKAAEEIIEKNKCAPRHYALNIIISAGESERGLRTPENPQPTITMMLSPAPQNFPDVHAIISQSVRRNEGSPLSQIKSCNYGDNILAMQEAEGKGANEAIMLNNAGHITCATSSNIFAVVNEELTTPPLADGVMNGITRSLLIEKYDAAERSLTPEDLQNAQGIYLTNSIRGVVPVITLNGVEIPAPSLHIPQYFHLD